MIRLRKSKLNKFVFTMLFLLITFLSLTACNSFYEHIPESAVVQTDSISIPDDAAIFKTKKFNKAIMELQNAGFTNIQAIPVYNVDSYNILSEIIYELVDTISVDNNTSFKKGDLFDKDAEIIITYHLYEKDYPDIAFDTYTVKDIYENYESNPMRAIETYVDKYVELVGKVSEIGSSGNYILICAEDDLEGINYVYCHVSPDEFKDQIYSLSKGDMVVVKGKMNSMTILKKYQMDVYAIQQ